MTALGNITKEPGYFLYYRIMFANSALPSSYGAKLCRRIAKTPSTACQFLEKPPILPLFPPLSHRFVFCGRRGLFYTHVVIHIHTQSAIKKFLCYMSYCIKRHLLSDKTARSECPAFIPGQIRALALVRFYADGGFPDAFSPKTRRPLVFRPPSRP